MSDRLEIPRLKVKKDWYVGLHEDPVDRSHPDVHDDQLVQEALMESITRRLLSFWNVNPHPKKNPKPKKKKDLSVVE